MQAETGDPGLRVQMRVGGQDRSIVVPQARIDQLRRLGERVLKAPFEARTWRELAFYLLGGALGFVGLAFIVLTMAAGTFLLVTFLGVVIIAASARGAHGLGAWHRALAHSLLGEEINEPQAFVSPPGLFGWLRAALRDRAGWRTVAYSVLKIPLFLFGLWFALGTWIDAFSSLTYPLFGDRAASRVGVAPFRSA